MPRLSYRVEEPKTLNLGGGFRGACLRASGASAMLKRRSKHFACFCCRHRCWRWSGTRKDASRELYAASRVIHLSVLVLFLPRSGVLNFVKLGSGPCTADWCHLNKTRRDCRDQRSLLRVKEPLALPCIRGVPGEHALSFSITDPGCTTRYPSHTL